MLWLTIKGLLARKRRLFTTALAVTLGVAFMSGTLVLTDTIGKTFDDMFGSALANTDVQVRQVAAFEGRLRDAAGLYTQAADKAVARELRGTASGFATSTSSPARRDRLVPRPPVRASPTRRYWRRRMKTASAGAGTPTAAARSARSSRRGWVTRSAPATSPR